MYVFLKVKKGHFFGGDYMNLENIFSFENLYDAHKKCRRSKQHKGEIIRLEVNISENIYKLQKEIISRKYKVGKYKEFIIYEPKERLIQALPYRDRIVLRCFCDNVLIPKIEKKLINDNVACRKGKGTKYGMDRLKYFLQKEYFKNNDNKVYYLKCDIRKYFPSINHNILINNLKRIDFTGDEFWFIKKIINEQPDNLKRGLALGNQSSQWFALYYLDKIDRLIKEELQIKSYVRYMDDFILLHRDKKYLQYCLERINKVCIEKLDLELNQKTQIGLAYNGIDFLGFNHILTNSGKVIRKLRFSSKQRMRKHIKTIRKLKDKSIIDEEYVGMRINAFKAHLKHSNEKSVDKLLSNLDKKI